MRSSERASEVGANHGSSRLISEHATPASVSNSVQTVIRRNVVKPGRRRRIAPKRALFLKRLEKHLVYDFFNIIMGHEAPYSAGNHGGILPIERIEIERLSSAEGQDVENRHRRSCLRCRAGSTTRTSSDRYSPESSSPSGRQGQKQKVPAKGSRRFIATSPEHAHR